MQSTDRLDERPAVKHVCAARLTGFALDPEGVIRRMLFLVLGANGSISVVNTKVHLALLDIFPSTYQLI